MHSIAHLAELEAKLVDDLRKVREEIASRAGEVDPPPAPPKPPPPPPKPLKAVKKA